MHKVHCTACGHTFSVAHGGLFDVIRHVSSGGLPVCTENHRNVLLSIVYYFMLF